MNTEKGEIYLILGGSRSGKSTRAEALAEELGSHVTYVATCRTDYLDAEMKDRIAHHKNQRPRHWETVENQFDLVQLATQQRGKVILLDCLTLWLSNEMENASIPETLDTLNKGLDAFIEHGVTAVIVSNELGMGIVPLGKEVREYRDLAGWANQAVAKKAKHVEFTIAGLPLNLKTNYKTCALVTEEK